MDPIFIIVLIVLFLCLLGLSWFAGKDAPYVATIMEEINPVLKSGGVKKNAVFYELGSGDGRVVLAAAKLGAKANGIEQSWIRVWYSRFSAYRKGFKSVNFFHGDIFKREYFPADIVYIFLLPKAVDRLEKKLQTELKPGSRVITQTFHFKNWQPVKKIQTLKQKIKLGKDKYAGDFWIYQK